MRRIGTKKKAFYRIVVADQRTSRNGRFIEQLGHYDPRKDPPALTLDREKAQDWLSKGAQPTDTVRGIFAHEGLVERLAARAIASAPKAPASAPAVETNPTAEAAPKIEAVPVAEEAPAAEPSPEPVPENIEAEAADSAPAEEQAQEEQEAVEEAEKGSEPA